MLRAIAPCAVQVGNGAEFNGVDTIQPCRDPGTNEFIARKFADGTWGALVNYRDYSRALAKVFECGFTGRGVLSGSELRITETLTNGKWKRCEVLISGMPRAGQKTAEINFELAPGCQSESICSHDAEAFGGISGRTEKSFSPAFDCQRARTETEKTICLDWNLSELDLNMAIIWSRRDDGISNHDLNDQMKWRGTRDACGADNACIKSAYQKRMRALCSSRGGQLSKQFECSK